MKQADHHYSSDTRRAVDTSALAHRLSYIPEFDGIRGVALLIVVISHTSVLYQSRRWLAIPGGFLALDMFFVLSGFLITALMLREQAETGRLRFGAFYLRRALRLLPALFALLLAHAIYSAVAARPAQVESSTLWSVGFYYANWKLAAGEPFVGELKHLWSLSVEEQFYLIWPCVIALVLPLRRRIWIVSSVIVAAIAAVAVHRMNLWQTEPSWFRLYVRTDTRAEGLLFGALLAHLWMRGKTPRHGIAVAAWVASAFLASCLIFFQPHDGSLYLGVFTVIALAWGIVILAMVETDWPINRLLRLRASRALGQVSYGCYLWHLPVFMIVRRHTPDWPAIVRVVLAVSLTAAATYLSWILVERPFLRWKARARPAAAPYVH